MGSSRTRRFLISATLTTAFVGCSSSSAPSSSTSDGGQTVADTGGAADTGAPQGCTTCADTGSPGPDAGNVPEATTADTSAPDGSDTDASACQQSCITNNMAAYQKFAGYELTNCGCQAGSPCNGMCTAECANPALLSMTSPCGICLFNEAGMGTSSACTVQAGLTCVGDSACSPFVTCEQACP